MRPLTSCSPFRNFRTPPADAPAEDADWLRELGIVADTAPYEGARAAQHLGDLPVAQEQRCETAVRGRGNVGGQSNRGKQSNRRGARHWTLTDSSRSSRIGPTVGAHRGRNRLT